MPDGVPPPGSGLVDATRALLGRDPAEAEARARPADPIAALAASQEFGAQLLRIAAGLPTRHVTLPPAALAAAWDWARASGLLSGAAAALPPSPGALLPGLLHLPPVAARITALPGAQQAALRQAAAKPGRTAGHLLTRAAAPEDHACLAGLLFGPGAMAAAAAEAPAVPLLLLLRHALGGERFRQAILRPLAEGGPLPGEGLSGPDLLACAEWLARRLGAEPCPGAPPLHGALLAALLRLPTVAEMLGGIWPAERAAVLAALPEVAAGLHQLRTPVLPDDAAHASLVVLGRPLQGEPPPVAGTRWDLLRGLLMGPEFRGEVLHRLVEEAAPPHAGLSAGQRRMAAAWLRDRLALHPPAPGSEPPGGLALLRRLLALPAIAGELARQHGYLWTDAEEALARQGEAEAAGLAGGIDYVTGDRIVGWARRGDGAPVEVEVLCNGRLLGTARADKPRPAAEDGARGFRLLWDGRRTVEDRARFQLREPGTGRPIGAAFALHPLLAEARPALQAITAQLAEARATLQRLEGMLPQLESFAAWPPELYAQFRRQHAVPPPGPVADGPLIDIVIDGTAGTVRGLRRTLDSLAAQGWAHWTATILAPPAAQALADQVAARDPRIRAWPVEADASRAERAAAAAGEGGLVLLLPAGTLLDPAALAWFAHAASLAPGAAGFLVDEDEVVEPFRGVASHCAPVLRRVLDEWSLAFADPGGALVCAARPALDAAWAALGTGESRWALWAALRRQGPVGHIPRRLASVLRAEQPEPVASAGPPSALRRLLRRPWLLDEPAQWEAPPSRITVIVPTRDGGALLREALASLAAKAADPAVLEVLVIDNGSTVPETLAILAAGEAAGRFRLLRLPEPFNWSRLNNLAVREARGDLLLFLNDDTRMLTAGWDRILRRLLAEPEVGAVGARLLYEDRTIQHAGVLCGLEGLVGHEGVGEPGEAPGPLGRWQTLRAAGAVTGAFLACRRAAFEAAGGFDEQALPVSFNDVDFCLKLRAAGLAVLYEPRIALMHYESKSRGHDDADPIKQERAEAEQGRLIDRWGEALLLDPGWNPHWSRWTRPFAALREPSPEEIARHLAASCRERPWAL
jgi:GT2 family glycosyltransferase